MLNGVNTSCVNVFIMINSFSIAKVSTMFDSPK